MKLKHIFTARALRLGLLFSLVFSLLCSLAYWRTLDSFSRSLEHHLQHELLNKIFPVELFSVKDYFTKEYLAQRINRDLAGICTENTWQLLQNCSASILRIDDASYDYEITPDRQITLDWYTNKQHKALKLGIYFQVNWHRLLLMQLCIALSCFALISAIPKPVSPARLQWIRQLRSAGQTQTQALQLTQPFDSFSPHQQQKLRELSTSGLLSIEQCFTALKDPRITQLSADQEQWLQLGLRLYPGQISAALRIAQASATLEFEPENSSVVVHGIRLALPSTPFLYYYWYALKRVYETASEGWYINPMANRADMDSSDALIALITRYGGHGKTVSDLRSHGVRAKTLDQNRSKIKEELVKLLGEELAKPYLFDMERDARTARYQYRLSRDPALILVGPEPTELLAPVPLQHNQERLFPISRAS